MYPNYIENRKTLGYKTVNDTICGTRLVLITDSSLLLIKSLNVNCKTKKIILVIVLVSRIWFSHLEPAEAIGFSLQHTSILRIQPNFKDTPEVKFVPIVSKRFDKIRLMPTKKMVPLIYLNIPNVYINEIILKRLRAGDLSSNLVLIGIGGVVYLMLLNIGVDAFAILEQFGKMNEPSATPGFGSTGNPTSTQIAVVPTVAQDFNDMLLKFNEPKTNFMMTKDEALKLIKQTYSGQLEITANERISDWQAAKKIYHASDFGINPKDYGMTRDNINHLQSIGLTNYVREGLHPLPPIKLVKAYQMAVKELCDHSKHFDGKYSSRGEQKIHDVSYRFNENTRQVAGFNKETGDLITAGKFKPQAFGLFLDTMHLGHL
jgi:hypothetical protein